MPIPAHFEDLPIDPLRPRAARRQLRLEARGATASGETAEVLIHNISATGLLIESPAVLAQDERIELALRGQWFEFQVQPMADQGGRIDGALVVMRCIARRKSLEERLFAAEFTDPLTRLTNRIAFVAMLDHLVARPQRAALALFDIDHFMRLNMRFGQNAGDDLLIAFAGLLRAMTRSDDIISRVGGERFAVIMPALAPAAAAAACAPVVETFAEAGRAALGGNFAVSTSVGVAEIALSADDTVRQAELALFLAKAKGRSRIETAR